MPANGKHSHVSGSVVERLHSFMQAHDLDWKSLPISLRRARTPWLSGSMERR
jgi:hypothetical protein